MPRHSALHSAVAMFGVLLGQAEVELGMKAFGGMDVHLKLPRGDVLKELADAFTHFNAVI